LPHFSPFQKLTMMWNSRPVALYWKNNTVGLDQFRKYLIDGLTKT